MASFQNVKINPEDYVGNLKEKLGPREGWTEDGRKIDKEFIEKLEREYKEKWCKEEKYENKMDPEGTLDDLLDVSAIPDFEAFKENIGKAKDRLKELEEKGIVEPDDGKGSKDFKHHISMV